MKKLVFFIVIVSFIVTALILNKQFNEKTASEESHITINNTRLTPEQTEELTALYGPIQAANYWYDSETGLYGRIGEAYAGSIKPGHSFGFGALARDASNGTTGVLVNGREIPASELAQLNKIFGSVALGSYWLKADGSYGVSGDPTARGNLYAMAAAKAKSSSGGGDNFWSSGLYSGGNYNSDNSQGYVSVPGYGPVDYGF